VLLAFVPVAAGITPGLILVMIPIFTFFNAPNVPLMDAYVLETCSREKLAFGSARMWGSVSYALMSIVLGVILPLTGVEASFYVYGLAALPFFLMMVRRKDGEPTARKEKKKSMSLKEMRLGRLFKNYYFLTYLLYAIFLNMPISASMSFLPFLVEEVGSDSAQLGLAAGFRAMLEVPMLFLLQPLRRRISLPLAIIIAGSVYAVAYRLYSAAGSLLHIMLIQMMLGLAGGLMIGAGVSYVHSLAPEGLNSTAQAINGTTNAAAAIVGNVLGGVFVTIVGVRAFFRVSSFMILGALAFLAVTLLLGRRGRRDDRPRSSGSR
jgi:PPP family 3-phenylpropionic acid transporter